ncbi:hypothetical protein RN001_007039 [Aquatica leii]|uniref:Uncharacterized protein n=1 Tax=Aquatica leii TaxID=1421715 RepID=A0AAN7P933_9COLE|nr:hypothetical protein RN001_007039 [Aquatica leii]
MSGFDPKKKQEAKVQLAIKLGAKPPKKVYKNYKELLEEKKNQTLEQKQNLQFQQLGKNEFGESLGKSKRFNRKRKFIKGSLLEAYGVPSYRKIDERAIPEFDLSKTASLTSGQWIEKVEDFAKLYE